MIKTGICNIYNKPSIQIMKHNETTKSTGYEVIPLKKIKYQTLYEISIKSVTCKLHFNVYNR